jgi:type VI secretion system protein ImpB
MSDSGQKFIGRNRAPRVQIEYDLETGGAQKKINLPFVMAVMSDLKGDYAPDEKPTPMADRKFEEISSSTFDSYLKATKPRLSFDVANKLGAGGENLHVEIGFESMKDFTPGRIAEKVAPLKELLDARNQLKNLLSYMDGKPDAEKRIEELLANPALLKSLAASAAPAADETPAKEG